MSEPEAEREDRFSFVWPILAVIFGLVCNVLVSGGKFDALIQLSLLPVLLIGFVTAIVGVVALTCSAYRRCWRRALSALAAVPAGLLAMPGLWSGVDVASELRLIANLSAYQCQIASLSAPAGQRRMRWNWGGNTTAVTGGEPYSFIYDESVSLPTALCSRDSWRSADRPWCDPDHSEPRAWRLWRHFYVIETSAG